MKDDGGVLSRDVARAPRAFANAAPGNAPRVVVVGDTAALVALEAEWRELSEAARDASVFLSWEWHRTWWEVFARPGEHPHVVTVRDGGALVGLLPLYRSRSLLPGRVTLRLIGTGEARADEVITEYGDVLARGEDSGAVADAIVAHLATFERWDRVAVPCVLEGSLLIDACRRRPALPRLERAVGCRYRVPLSGDEAAYLERLGSGRARRIARSRRALERDGGLVAEPTRDVADLDRALQGLAELNHERQSDKGRRSVFASDRFRLFHAMLGRQLLPQGAVSVVRYRLGAHLLAVLYCLHDATGAHYYQSGFARRGANRYMPLTMAHLDEMQRGRAAGRAWYDLMRGQPPCYKDGFGCETTPMFDLTLYRTHRARNAARLARALRGRAGGAVRTLRRRLRARGRSLTGS